MENAQRFGCPINLTLETLGDRWSLIVIRDIMFGNRRHFRELLQRSEEGIASIVLADRLKRLVEAGLLTRGDDPSISRRRSILRRAAIALVPLLAHMGAWGCSLPPPPRSCPSAPVCCRKVARALGCLHARTPRAAHRWVAAAPLRSCRATGGLREGGRETPRTDRIVGTIFFILRTADI